jgi:hypothetical protein
VKAVLQITADEIAWSLKLAPPLAKCIVRLWNEVYSAGIYNNPLKWDKSWITVFQTRTEILEITTAIYMLAKVHRLLASETRTVLLLPGAQDVVCKPPPVVVPFTYE